MDKPVNEMTDAELAHAWASIPEEIRKQFPAVEKILEATKCTAKS